MPEPVVLTGTFTGFTDGNPPLVGVLVTGTRRIQKWLVCCDPAVLARLRSDPPEHGSLVTVRAVFRPESNRMELLEILPV